MWTLDLPWASPPLSLNQRLHWARRASITRDVKETVYWLTKAQHIPTLDRISVTLEWQPKDRRRRDADNPTATLKPCLDGLVLAGVIPDDTPHHITAATIRIHPGNGQPATLRLHITPT